jgi:polyferredoxin
VRELKVKNPLKKEIKETQKEFKQRTITLILAGFGLVAALAWNDAISALFDTLFPKGAGLIGKFLYALLVTIIVVIISLQLKKISEKKG